MIVGTQSLTLEDFWEMPETQPASEFINGEIFQKPRLQGEYSVLQERLCARGNEVSPSAKVAYAFPELRCVIDGHAIVPNVFRWERIPRTESGRVANRFEFAPDWVIEILSPEQSQTKVLEKLLLSIDH